MSTPKYPLVLRSGRWVPDYENYAPKEDTPRPYRVSRLDTEWIEIPVDHPDYVALSENRQFRIMRKMSKNWVNYSFTMSCSVAPVFRNKS